MGHSGRRSSNKVIKWPVAPAHVNRKCTWNGSKVSQIK